MLSEGFNFSWTDTVVERGCAGGESWGVRQNWVEISVLPRIPVM